PLTAQLQEEALTLSKSMLPNRVAMQTYADSLSYFIGAKIKANSYDQKLEELQRERIRIEGELLPPEKRNESYGYLELKALLGMTLAKEGKFAEAEKVADDIVPSPRITEGVIFEGLYQLRIQLLAEHALAVGDRAGIEKQFGKLVEIYKSMSLIKDKQRLLHLWEGMEAGYYSRLEARTRARKVS
ncbi:MAG: hypothetical protein K2Z81_10555, partial [Cyanobacteria bacterium]|nr:hypothetical protein [Cyanobacteriota bacterium]